MVWASNSTLTLKDISSFLLGLDAEISHVQPQTLVLEKIKQ